mmetsp:Transcript_5374/g.11774  ORF Transcript_5374/g.11774 Transcript_5374/m.11774 type:complete len:399 (+) Transcript_5374:206-1402(+)
MPGPPPTWQYIVAAYTPLVTGNLSAMGSSVIIYSMIGPGRWRKKLIKPQNRILLAMSIYDLLHSFAMGWTFLLTPKGYGVPGAQGNMSTCRMVGFLIEIGGNATGAYNSLLSIYYWVTICKGVKPATFAKYEPFAHVIIFVIFCGFAIAGVVTKLFNPGIATCFIGSYPPGCEMGLDAPPCDRFPPQTMSLLYEVFAQFWVQMFIVIVTVTHVLIWRNVRKQDRVMRRYSSLHLSGAAQSRRRLSIFQELGRSRSVAVQSTLYVFAFISCWIGPTLFHLICWIWGIQSFWALFIVVLFTPLQGFWNAFVFARPTYIRLRKKCPELGRFQVARIVFLDPDPVKRSTIKRNWAVKQIDVKEGGGSGTSHSVHPENNFDNRNENDDDNLEDLEDGHFETDK